MIPNEPENYQSVAVELLITSNDAPLKGFYGVSFRANLKDPDLMSLYSISTKPGETTKFGECGAFAYSRLGGQVRGVPLPYCIHACYESLEARAQRKTVACDSGKAFWLVVGIYRDLDGVARIAQPGPAPEKGSLLIKGGHMSRVKLYQQQIAKIQQAEQQKRPYLYEQVIQSTRYLTVKAPHGTYQNINLDVDEAFRKALLNTGG